MLLEVRLAIPSKPKKVLQPSDFSLRSVLQRAREEEKNGQERSGQGGTGVQGSIGGTDPGSIGGKVTGMGVGGTKGGAAAGGGTGMGSKKDIIDLSNLLHALHPKLGLNPGVKPVPEGPKESLAHSVMGRKDRADGTVCTKPRHEQVRGIVEVFSDTVRSGFWSGM